MHPIAIHCYFLCFKHGELPCAMPKQPQEHISSQPVSMTGLWNQITFVVFSKSSSSLRNGGSYLVSLKSNKLSSGECSRKKNRVSLRKPELNTKNHSFLYLFFTRRVNFQLLFILQFLRSSHTRHLSPSLHQTSRPTLPKWK